jgi:hypothetical protein
MQVNHVRMLQIISMAAAVTVLGLAACSEPEENDPPVVNNGKPVYGTMKVDLKVPAPFAQAYTSVLGTFYNGESPSAVAWEKKTVSGACTLYTPKKPFCPTPCGSGSLCVADNTCKSEATLLSVGKITVTGFKTKAGGQTITLVPPSSKNYQVSITDTLLYPPFAEGDDLSFAAEGDTEAGAFTLTGKGIKPLKLHSDSITLADGQPVILNWEGAASPTASQIEVEVDISHHGGSKGKISCVTPDNGTLAITADLVTELKALGMSGFPKIDVSRRAVTKHATMQARLVLESSDTRQVNIPGLISCDSDENCPNGQDCKDDMKCGAIEGAL